MIYSLNVEYSTTAGMTLYFTLSEDFTYKVNFIYIVLVLVYIYRIME